MPAALANLVVVVLQRHQCLESRHGHQGELAADSGAHLVQPGCIPAQAEFLRHVRATCTRLGLVLIFDEVLSGFRMCRGGAQEYFGVTPDLCTLAKALGGGVPIAAVCGKTDVMSVLNPVGHTIMSRTYTGPDAVMGAIAADRARETRFLRTPQRTGRSPAPGNHRGAPRHRRPARQGIGARFGLYLVTEPVTNYRQAVRTIARWR
jgi:glutamate-1-semialdehyde 2,1-aminomutase